MSKFDRQTIEARVKEIIVQQLGVDADDVKTDTRLEADLGADSIDEVELIMAMDKAFYINISDHDAEALKDWTVADICNLVEKKLRKSNKR